MIDEWMVEMLGRKRTGAAGSDKAMNYGGASSRTEEDWTLRDAAGGVWVMFTRTTNCLQHTLK